MQQGNFTVRPDYWELDNTVQLAQGLVFFGGGRFPGTTRYHDSSLYGNTGTLNGFALTGTSSNWINELGRAMLDHDGTNDCVTCSGLLIPAVTGNIATFSAWFKTTSDSAKQYLIGFNRAAGFERSLGIVLDGSAASDPISLREYIGSEVLSTSAAYAINTWTHVVASFTRGVTGAHWLWVNGVAQTLTGVLQMTDGWGLSDQLRIGASTASGTLSLPFVGRLADPMVHSRLLSLPEITALAQQDNVMLAVGGNPLLRYRRKWWPVGTTATPPATGNRRRRLLIAGGRR